MGSALGVKFRALFVPILHLVVAVLGTPVRVQSFVGWDRIRIFMLSQRRFVVLAACTSASILCPRSDLGSV